VCLLFKFPSSIPFFAFHVILPLFFILYSHPFSGLIVWF
jgi:hypothetical protein